MGRNWKCRVIIVIKTDLSGFIVTMHSGLCEQNGLTPSGFDFLFRTRPRALWQQTPPEPVLMPLINLQFSASPDGKVWTAGSNIRGGQLGHHSESVCYPVFNPVEGLPPVRQIAVGELHSVVMTRNGTVMAAPQPAIIVRQPKAWIWLNLVFTLLPLSQAQF